MKKFTVLSFLFFFSISAYSQDYLMKFFGTGASESVENVKIENLTQGTNLTIKGTDILNLKADVTGLNTIYENSEKTLQVYPNPATEYTTIELYAAAPGNALIAVYDQVGKTIVQTGINLATGTHTFQIDGLNRGLYTVRVTSGTYSCTGKIISLQKGTSSASIAYKSFSDGNKNEVKLKSTNATILMPYNTGDRLKITGIFGIYSTVLTMVPHGDNNIEFEFIACTDGDNNYYPVVKIGNQTWMAENLKTIKYIDGDFIPNGIGWQDLTTPAYCWYNNDPDNEDTYGVLYNWYAVNTRKLCSAGWQVPTDDEWAVLTTYLGGDDVAGNKLRETGTAHWNSPNTGATNETGFTAIPGGFRQGSDGSFHMFGTRGYWWSTTEYDADNAWDRNIEYGVSNAGRSFDVKKFGLSARCLKEPSEKVTDVDGNIYHTITIGTQKWMVENLKTTRYNDNTDIPNVTDGTAWTTLTTAAYCWYNDDDVTNKTTYGALYNWYAINSGKLCPTGWHVPVDAEWNTLIAFSGGEGAAGGKLKERGTTHWSAPNISATNAFGFTALPGGVRFDNGSYSFIKERGFWWSYSIADLLLGTAGYYEINSDTGQSFHSSFLNSFGLSVRCVKD